MIKVSLLSGTAIVIFSLLCPVVFLLIRDSSAKITCISQSSYLLFMFWGIMNKLLQADKHLAGLLPDNGNHFSDFAFNLF